MSELRRKAPLSANAAASRRFAIAVSRTNGEITDRLLDGALQTLQAHGAAQEAIEVVFVPGAFELPMAAAKLVAAGVDAVICIGAIIRGETSHYDHLCAAVATGIEDVAVRSGTPAIFGVLTCDTPHQASARAGGDRGNKGSEAALAAIEMALLFASLEDGH